MNVEHNPLPQRVNRCGIGDETGIEMFNFTVVLPSLNKFGMAGWKTQKGSMKYTKSDIRHVFSQLCIKL